jgi:DNA repair protein RecN (Recombination protein N)
LVEIHGQSSGLNIAKGSKQRELLDRYAGSSFETMLTSYQDHLNTYQNVKSRITELKKNAASREESLAQLKLFNDSFLKLKPLPDELGAIDDEISRLSSVEELRIAVTQAMQALESEDSGVINALALAKKSLDAIKSKDSKVEKFSDDFNEAFFVLADVVPELTSYLESLEADPERLDFLQERKSAINSFIKKWSNEGSADQGLRDVIQKHSTISSSLEDLTGGEQRIAELEKELSVCKKNLVASAIEMTKERTNAAQKLSSNVSNEMHALSMPHTNLVIEVASPNYESGLKEGDFTTFGCDSVSMYLQTHKDGPLVSLAKGASGGEMSRVMLALEVVLAASNPVGTYVFDEVDAGVGGAAAIEVGRRLHALSKDAQVIVVTHLPQVAAWGDQHYVVQKSSDGTVVSSGVISVQGDERVSEIARMLAGLQDSSSAKEHAAELLNMRLKE